MSSGMIFSEDMKKTFNEFCIVELQKVRQMNHILDLPSLSYEWKSGRVFGKVNYLSFTLSHTSFQLHILIICKSSRILLYKRHPFTAQSALTQVFSENLNLMPRFQILSESLLMRLMSIKIFFFYQNVRFDFLCP